MSDIVVVGIDPGVTGATVVLDGDRNVLATYRPKESWYLCGDEYRPDAMLATLGVIEHKHKPALWVLEKQWARPADGPHQAFLTGYGYGLWFMALAALSLPSVDIAPQRWQAVITKGSPGAGPKARAKHVCEVLLPNLGGDHNVRDAACIALYGLTVVGVEL